MLTGDKNHPISQLFYLIVLALLQCVYMHIYCMRVNMTSCFPDFFHQS